MRGGLQIVSFSPAACARANAKWLPFATKCGLGRLGSTKTTPPDENRGAVQPGRDGDGTKDEGAMSRRLAEMSEEALQTGGRSARRAVEEAGFSEELKSRLEEKIAGARFKSENAAAFAQASMPASAPKHAREIAAAGPWTGSETIEDASLRMLNDAHKPLKAPLRTSGVRIPTKIDAGRSSHVPAPGVRLANARDRSSVYTVLKDSSMSEEEREKYRAELKQRFSPHARSVPATLQGLQSLANERIEDAIARGQFKNLPRGQKIERDYNANSPFINTTEYFMNKIIQKQEIVPPWIEKQQELVSTANKFRARLRADWKRHVARSIASRGGPIEVQVTLAEEYALAESVTNPSRMKAKATNDGIEPGAVPRTTVALHSTKSPSAESTSASIVEIGDHLLSTGGNLTESQGQTEMDAKQLEIPGKLPVSRPPAIVPFRDAQWEKTEAAYLQAAVNQLNSLTRSYNLMAPDLAKKTYFSLEREMKSCFADVAPLVADAIRQRASAPKIKGVEVIGHKPGSVLEKFSGKVAPVYDEQRPKYGFKEFWKDLFSAPGRD